MNTDFDIPKDQEFLKQQFLLEYSLAKSQTCPQILLDGCSSKEKYQRDFSTVFLLNFLADQEDYLNGYYLENQSHFYESSSMPLDDVTFLRHEKYDNWLDLNSQRKLINNVIKTVESKTEYERAGVYIYNDYLDILLRSFGDVLLNIVNSNFNQISKRSMADLADIIFKPSEPEVVSRALKKQYRAQLSNYCREFDELERRYNRKDCSTD